MSALLAILARDVRLGFAAGGGAAQTLIFFFLTIVLFALAVGPDAASLKAVAAPILWTAALLAAFLSLDRLFQADFEDGSLEIIAQRTPTFGLLVLIKAAAHWLTTAAPLIVAAPIAGLLLNLPGEGYWPLLATLILGTPALSLIGAGAAALTFPLRRAGVLTTILVGPLYAPSLIFGVMAAEAGAVGDPLFQPTLLFLCAASLLALITAPLAGGAGLRLNLS
ncbi:MAG: heme exporter protein CcmB [Pseudomonadota bacterium]